MEAVHTFGLSVFLWKVLPVLTIVQAAVVFSAVGVIPSILQAFSSKKESESKAKRVVLTALDVVACALQFAGLIGLTLLIYKKHGKYLYTS